MIISNIQGGNNDDNDNNDDNKYSGRCWTKRGQVRKSNEENRSNIPNHENPQVNWMDLLQPNQAVYNWNGFNCTNVMEHDDDFETEGYSSWLATSLVSRRWRSHCVAGDYHRNHHHRQHHHHPASSSSAALSAPLSSSSVLTSWSENDHDNVNYSQNFFFSTATKSLRYSCLWWSWGCSYSGDCWWWSWLSKLDWLWSQCYSGLAYVGEKDEEGTMFDSMLTVIIVIVAIIIITDNPDQSHGWTSR